MFKLVHIGTPVNIRNKLNVLQDKKIDICPGRLKISRDSFRWRTALAWNILPEYLINAEKISSFKKQLHRHIVKNRADVVQRPQIELD